MRRVIIKARYVKLKGPQSLVGFAHLRHLQREGASRDGEPGKLYGRTLDRTGGARLPAIAPPKTSISSGITALLEDGVAIGDLKGFTPQPVDQMERDLETRLALGGRGPPQYWSSSYSHPDPRCHGRWQDP